MSLTSEVSHAAMTRAPGESPNDNSAVEPLVYRPEQAARILGYSTSWLAKRRLDGTGPEFIKGTKNCYYQHEALVRWLAGQKRCHSTAEYSTGGAK